MKKFLLLLMLTLGALAAIAQVSEVSYDKMNRIIDTNNRPIIVDCYATWCGPCKQYAPIFDAMSYRATDVIFLRIDIDENPQLMEEFNFNSIPTTIVFIKDKQGTCQWKAQSGLLNKFELGQLVSEARRHHGR